MDETLQVSHGLVLGRRIGYRYLSLISTGLTLVLTLSIVAGNVEGGCRVFGLSRDGNR